MEKRTYYLWYIVWSVIIMPLHQNVAAPVWRRTNRNKNEREGNNLFEGDIILPASEQRRLLGAFLNHRLQKRMAVEDDQQGSGSGEEPELTKDKRWPDGRVPYKRDTNLDYETSMTFIDAMTIWEAETCLRFDLANDNDTDYLYLLGNGCSSGIGRQGGAQNVKIGKKGCTSEGNALHELGHAVGLWHEHTRLDRDTYIDIYWDNIDKTDNYRQNFIDYDHPFVPNVGYDIGSIMHYGPKAYSSDDDHLYTIGIKHPLPDCMDPNIMGQRTGLSFKDKLRVNLMYNCTAHVDALLKNIEACLYTPLPDELTPEPPPTEPTEPPTECKEIKNIESGTQVRLQFYQESQKPDPNTVYCQRTCKKRTNCMVDPSSTCSEEHFQIFLVDQDRKNKKIKVGDRVAFRSMYRTLHWMDCSREACELQYCSPDSICLEHQLEIHRENQRTSSRIQTKDKVYLKAVGEDKFLNCAGTQCRLVAECEGSAQGSSSGESGSCGKRQLFSITKELECNTS